MPTDWPSTAPPWGFSQLWTLVTVPCLRRHARGILATRLLGLPWWSTPWPRLALLPCAGGTKWRPRERRRRQAASLSTCCQVSPRCTAASPTSSSWGTAWMTRRRQSKCCDPLFFCGESLNVVQWKHLFRHQSTAMILLYQLFYSPSPSLPNALRKKIYFLGNELLWNSTLCPQSTYSCFCKSARVLQQVNMVI